MMKLPTKINPLRLAKTRSQLIGTLSLVEMSRLAVLVGKQDGEVALNLHFGIDDYHQSYCQGHVTAELTLQCQRCNQAFLMQHDMELKLGLIAAEAQTKSLDDDYEPLLCETAEMRLAGIIEDELILGLPLVPKHDEQSCQLMLKKEFEPEKQARASMASALAGLKEL